MPRLDFISDENLQDAVDKLLAKAHAALFKAETQFSKNVIDPFAALFEMAGFHIDEQAWRTCEKTRQAQKTLSNHLGAFHQDILGKVSGWENLKTGKIFDLISHEHKIIAEIKNKYNTLKGSDQANLYTSLENLVMPKNSLYKNYTAYYVVIVPKNPLRFDLPFVPSDQATGKRKPENPLIRTIDGYSFYGKVTGTAHALGLLFKVLPLAIRLSQQGKPYPFDLESHLGLSAFFSEAYGKERFD